MTPQESEKARFLTHRAIILAIVLMATICILSVRFRDFGFFASVVFLILSAVFLVGGYLSAVIWSIWMLIMRKLHSEDRRMALDFLMCGLVGLVISAIFTALAYLAVLHFAPIPKLTTLISK